MAGPFATQGKLSENWPLRGLTRIRMKSKLQVMKFGGTSVGDAACIARAAQIVAQAARENAVVAVVSAMSGVTNRLVDAAKHAAGGDGRAGVALIAALRQQHEDALATLVRAENARAEVAGRIEKTLEIGRAHV